ncbi:MAG: twitching motility protein PilT [Thermoplasmatota archaeon]
MGSERDRDNAPSEQREPRIILDANALISPFQLGYNLDLELERTVPGVRPVVPSSVLRELEQPSKSKDWHVKAALRLARKYEVIDVKGKGDSPIFNLAVSRGWMVLTQDKRLRYKLNSRGITVVLVRGRGHLQVMEA